MTQLRHLLDPELVEAMWHKKDALEVIHEDPRLMYKGRFVEYLRVKADALYEENLQAGMAHELAIKTAQVELDTIVVDWKSEAKRRSRFA